eukprot:5087800-Prymnesium_polylepis.1
MPLARRHADHLRRRRRVRGRRGRAVVAGGGWQQDAPRVGLATQVAQPQLPAAARTEGVCTSRDGWR